MSKLKLSVLLLSVVMMLAGVSEASAATKRITGAALSQLLYGRSHTIYMPTGIGIRVRYDSKGVQYSGGKRTGDIVKASKNSWCDYTGKKLNACMSVWWDGKKFIARYSSGKTAFWFTVS